MASKTRSDRPNDALSDDALESAAEAPLYSDPFVGREPCREIKALPVGIRDFVAQACPRCGVQKDAPLAEDLRTCLLEGIGLDLMALDLPPADEHGLSRMKVQGSA